MDDNIYTISQKRKKLLVIILLALVSLVVLILLASLVWNYFATQKTVTLAPTDGTTITVKAQNGSSKSMTATSQKSFRLKNGSYEVSYSGGADYREKKEIININKNLTIRTPILDYSLAKLDSLLVGERTAARAALAATFDAGGYDLLSEKLFVRGEWYGVVLLPKSWYKPGVPADYIPRPLNINNTSDVLRTVLKKEGGQWKVVTKPSIIFYIDDHRDVPESVIRSINRLGH